MELSRYFRISSRTHHGVVLVTELAHGGGRPRSIRAIARHMHLSEKYLEELAGVLRTSGIITSTRGRAGGYRLARDPNAITMGDVVRALDGPVVLAHCQDSAATDPCPAAAHCRSRPFFSRLQQRLNHELDAMTLAELAPSPGEHV